MTAPGGYPTGRDLDAPHASRAAPTAECIYWRPLEGEPKGPGAAEYPIYIRQRALAALHDHFRGSAQQGILGFLIGALLQDPTTHQRWIEIEFIVRLTQAIYGDKTTLVISRVWERLQQEVSRTGGHMLGWYHSHPPLGIEIAPGDIEAHEQYFGRPWQVALVLGHGSKGPTGAVYRPSAGLPLGTTPLPFYEIVARDSVTPEGRRRTRVAWRNYKPDMKRTSGAVTGISAVLKALQVPAAKRAETPAAAAAAPPRRKRTTPPRGSAAIRLPEPAPEPAPASLPAPGIRSDASLSVPSTLLRSAVPETAPPRATPKPPPPLEDTPPQAPPQPATPAPAAAAPPAAGAPTPAAPPPPAPEPEPASPPAPSEPAAARRPAAAAEPEPRRASPAPAAPEPPGGSDARAVRPRARPTEEVLKDLATMLSGPRGRSSVPRISSPTAGDAPATEPAEARVTNPGRVTFTPTPDARSSGSIAAAEPPPEAAPETVPEPVPDAVEEVPEEPPVSYTPSPARRAPAPPPPAVDLAAETQPLETPPEIPVPPRVSGELAMPRRWSGEVTPPLARRTVGVGLDAAGAERRAQVRLPFVAALFVVLAGAAWWLFLRPQTAPAPAGAAGPGAGAVVTEPVLDTGQVFGTDPTFDSVVAIPSVVPSPEPALPDPLAPFDAIFDSLTAAIINYQATALRFDQGDRNCGTLSAALIAVDRLWIRYNAERRRVGAPLDSLRQALDQGVYGNVDSVDGHFRQSGCPRP